MPKYQLCKLRFRRWLCCASFGAHLLFRVPTPAKSFPFKSFQRRSRARFAQRLSATTILTMEMNSLAFRRLFLPASLDARLLPGLLLERLLPALE